MTDKCKKYLRSGLLSAMLAAAMALTMIPSAPVYASQAEEIAAAETVDAAQETESAESETEAVEETETAVEETTAVQETETETEPLPPATVTAAPTGLTVTAYEGKIRISWNAAEGAEFYTVNRQDPGCAMAPLADGENITATTFDDLDVLPGQTYSYCVKASGGGKSKTTGTLTVTAKVPGVTLGSASVASSGVVIKWTKLSNVDGYYVYRKSGTAGYKKIATVTGGSTSSWTDKNTVMGTTYTYTVRAFVKDDKGVIQVGSYNKTGVSVTVQIPGPTLKSAKAAEGKITLTWSAVNNAVRYYVYRKGNGVTGWTKIGTATGTSYVDKTVVTGKKYTYTVRALVSSTGGNVYSAYDTKGISAVAYIPTVKLLSATASGMKITVKWEAVAGAGGYRVYRKVPNSGWVKVKDLTGTSWTDTDTEIGGQYTYTVRAFVQDGSTYNWGGYDSKGIVGKIALHKPVISGCKSYSGGVLVTWDLPKESVDGYRIYRKTGTGSYTLIATLNSGTQNFYWNRTGSYAPVPGKEYTYAVRSYKYINGAASYSSYYSASAVCKPEEPLVVSVTESKGKTTFTWTASDGAAGYRLEMKTENGWTKIASVASSAVPGLKGTLTVASAELKDATGKKYTRFRVRAWAGSVWSNASDVFDTGNDSYSSSSILFFGDSITYGYTWNGVQTSVPFPSRVAALTGATVKNAGLSGRCAATLLQTDGAAMVESGGITFGGYDVVCIALGTNDYNKNVALGSSGSTDASTFYGAMRRILNAVREQNPNAEIVLITPNYRGFQGKAYSLTEKGGQIAQYDYSKIGMNVKNGKGDTLQDYCNAVSELAMEYDARIYNSVSEGVVTASNYQYRLFDALHPTRETYAMMGNSIAEFLMEEVLLPDGLKH